MAYEHGGFWQPMDTLREKNLLEELWAIGARAVEALVSVHQRRRVLARQARPPHRPHRLQGRVAGALAAPARRRGHRARARRRRRAEPLPARRPRSAWSTSRLVDLRDAAATAAAVRERATEVVFHLAAQSLVRRQLSRSARRPSRPTSMGTAHLLDALRDLDDVCVAVVVTTDKVYRNHEWPYPYREDDPLGGHDPYSASKAAAELVAASYRSAFLARRSSRRSRLRAPATSSAAATGRGSADSRRVRAWQGGSVLTIRRPAGDPSLAARARAARRLPAPGRAALACAEPGRRLQLRPAHRRGGDGRHGHRPGARGLRLGRVAAARATTAGPHEAGRLALEVARARAVLGVAPRWGLPRPCGERCAGTGASPTALRRERCAKPTSPTTRPRGSPRSRSTMPASRGHAS